MKKISLFLFLYIGILGFSQSPVFLNHIYYMNGAFDSRRIVVITDKQLIEISDGLSEGDGGVRTVEKTVSDYTCEDNNGLTRFYLTDTITIKKSIKNFLISNDLLLDMDTGYAYSCNDLILQTDEGIIFDGGINYFDFSSYLTEGNIIYQMQESDLKPGSVRFNFIPWAVKGNGTGQYFKLSLDQTRLDYVKRFPEYKKYLLFINGYANKNKPTFFINNSRVKELKISVINKGKNTPEEKVISLKDTMEPQLIELNNIDKDSLLNITIQSIYPGIKYEDTCLSWCKLIYKK